MKKRKSKYQHQDFICDTAPEGPVLVVEDWMPNENAGLYCHGGAHHGRK